MHVINHTCTVQKVGVHYSRQVVCRCRDVRVRGEKTSQLVCHKIGQCKHTQRHIQTGAWLSQILTGSYDYMITRRVKTSTSPRLATKIKNDGHKEHTSFSFFYQRRERGAVKRDVPIYNTYIHISRHRPRRLWHLPSWEGKRIETIKWPLMQIGMTRPLGTEISSPLSM